MEYEKEANELEHEVEDREQESDELENEREESDQLPEEAPPEQVIDDDGEGAFRDDAEADDSPERPGEEGRGTGQSQDHD